MPEFTTEVEIDPYEYVLECSNDEIDDLIECLTKEGYLDTKTMPMSNKKNLLDEEWEEVVLKLFSSRLLINSEDEEIIRLISKKF